MPLKDFSILGLIYCLSISLTYSQDKYFTLFDSITGIETSGLYNGPRYYELYKNTNLFMQTVFLKLLILGKS